MCIKCSAYYIGASNWGGEGAQRALASHVFPQVLFFTFLYLSLRWPTTVTSIHRILMTQTPIFTPLWLTTPTSVAHNFYVSGPQLSRQFAEFSSHKHQFSSHCGSQLLRQWPTTFTSVAHNSHVNSQNSHHTNTNFHPTMAHNSCVSGPQLLRQWPTTLTSIRRILMTQRPIFTPLWLTTPTSVAHNFYVSGPQLSRQFAEFS